MNITEGPLCTHERVVAGTATSAHAQCQLCGALVQHPGLAVRTTVPPYVPAQAPTPRPTWSPPPGAYRLAQRPT